MSDENNEFPQKRASMESSTVDETFADTVLENNEKVSVCTACFVYFSAP